MTIQFSANHATVGPDDDTDGINVIVSAPEFELVLWLSLEEARQFDKIPNTPWEGGSLRLGTSANAPVWWSCDDGLVSALVGQDDQIWGFAVSFPVDRLDAMKTEMEREIKQHYK